MVSTIRAWAFRRDAIVVGNFTSSRLVGRAINAEQVTGVDAPKQQQGWEAMNTDYCQWLTEGKRTECLRCGSINYEGNEPTCPPWITRSEPDGARLPHIKTRKQNNAAWREWVDAEEYKTCNAPHVRPM